VETPEKEGTVEETGRPRTEHSGVVARLFREGYFFDFFQAVRILERLFPEGTLPGSGPEPAEERIRFRPHTGLTFPPTDVHSVELLEGEPSRARVTVAFHGLYGVDSPLPVYFFDAIAQQSERALVLRDFLDIFNHRLYSFFYRSWRKYRPPLYFSLPTPDEYSQRSLCLAGLGIGGALSGSPLPPMQIAAFAGSLSCRRRTVEGLRNLTGWFFEGLHVAVEENVRRWVRMRTRPHLGGSSPHGFVLGTFSTIGEAVMDVSGKFRMELGPMALALFRGFLPGGEQARTLGYLIQLYLSDNLDYDVRLVLTREEVPVLKLGDGNLRLGLTTWVGRPATAVTSRVVEYS
jgi:type VI secretion system protein ImpH